MESILNPWPWYISGPLISIIMFLLIFNGKTFGVSSNLRTICSACGADKFSKFFDIKIKDHLWNLMFIFGASVGGFISLNYLSKNTHVEISENTKTILELYNINSFDSDYLPLEIFALESLNLNNIVILVVGGLLIGFGTRYAGGCTSGHAITGLSQLQLGSLISVIGFFIGGLIMIHLIYPILFL
jgi:uncharacterized membrane protein YedE/YeeE